VWPYLKPLRKWIRKQQRDNPEWDMPAAATPGATPEPQGKARSRTGGGGGGNAAGRSAAAQPHNKQLQYQHGSEQRRSAGGGIGGGGGGGNDSPKHHAHMSFHEAAIAQAKQSGVVSGGVRPGAVPLAPMAPAVTGGSSGPGSHTGPLRGPPAELFSGAMAGTAAAAAAPGSGARPAGGADGAAAGGPAGGSSSSSSHKAFRFNRQAILTALVEPTPVVHTRGRMAAR
jgi:serine/threonine-protein kinase PknG